MASLQNTSFDQTFLKFSSQSFNQIQWNSYIWKIDDESEFKTNATQELGIKYFNSA